MPEEWRALLGTSTQCECGETHRVPTRQVLIGPGAIEELADVLARNVAGRRGALVADGNTWDAAGQCVAAHLTGWRVAETVIAAGGKSRVLNADGATLTDLAAALPPPAELDFLLCVGSGTLTDLTKLTATHLRLPSVCVATAPSMNGYPSAIAAISRGGIKRTEPCEPPVAIICDTDILTQAPPEMIQAGLGDLLSKSTSTADWAMAHLVVGDHFCQRPVGLVEQAERRCLEAAAAIGRRDASAIELLMSGLIQSGISMAMAGSSAPASGGEHLVSHYWDMTAHAHHRKPDLHGRQVAVAAVATATLYEALMEHTAGGIDLDQAMSARPTVEELRVCSTSHFEPLMGPGPARDIADLVISKRAPEQQLRETLLPLAQDPAGFWGRLSGYMRPPHELSAAYRAARVPTRIEQIGVSPQQARAALLFGRHIRDRYTVLDLAADLGLLEELAERVVAAIT